MARTTGNASDLITFTRASTGTALTKVAYGPELVTNGGFDTDSDWTKGTGWTISGGQAVGTAVNGYLHPTSISLPVGTTMRLTFDAVVTSGTVSVRLGSWPYVTKLISSSGTYEIVAPITAIDDFSFQGTSFTGTIDNVSIKEVFFNDPTGTLKLISHPTNTPRVEYEANGVAKGLLIEEARTNLENYSETFAVGWSLGSSNFTDQKLSPSGENTAKEVTVTTANTNYLYKNYTVSPSTTYTFSFFCKSGTIDVENDLILAFYDQTNLSFISANATRTYTSSVNGFTRVHSTVTAPAGCTVLRCYPHRNITVSGTYDIYGAQLEAGSFPTSYIPTSGATATRSADIAQVSVSEFGYNDAQGTFVVEFQTPDFSDADVVDLGITSNNRFLIRNGLAFYRTTAGGQVTINYSASASNQRVAFAVQTNDAAAAVNGAIVGTDTTVTLFSDPTTLEIGALVNNSAVEKLNGHIKSINYYPLRLSDAKLQELTS